MHHRTRKTRSTTGLFTKAIDLTRTVGLGYSARVAVRYLGNAALIWAEAGRAAATGQGDLAGYALRYRPGSVSAVTRDAMFRAWVDDLITQGRLDRAEQGLERLRRRFPASRSFAKTYAQLAVERGDWADALHRWQGVEQARPDHLRPLPAPWVHRIGLDRALAQTDAMTPGRARALGMLSLAHALRNIEEAQALGLARKASGHYRDQVLALVVRVLSANMRSSAAIWWAQRLIQTSQTPRRDMPLLVDGLILASRFDDCDRLMADYAARYGRDTLWLRAMTEIAYRRGDLDAMRAVMQGALDAKLAQYHPDVRVLNWLYMLIHLYPEPGRVLPPDIQDLALALTARYDGPMAFGGMRVLLHPDRTRKTADRHGDQIAAARAQGRPMAPADQEFMGKIALLRRDWSRMADLAALPLPDMPDLSAAKQGWSIARQRIDLHLAAADVAAAEAAACDFLDRLQAAGFDHYGMEIASGLVFRLPISDAVLSRLLAAAQRLDFAPMVQRLSAWRDRYGDLDPAAALRPATRDRCFVLGNAPSVADLPLHLLQNDDVFCLNRGLRAKAIGLPQPKYLVVADPYVYRSHAHEIDADGASVDQFFIGANCIWRRQPTVPAMVFGTSGLKLPLRAFDPAPLHLHRGETVAILAAQIAMQMGYRDIYILGVDLDYGGAATHFYGGGRKETDRLSNFRPGGSGADLVNLSFASLQQTAAKVGCQMHNASPMGNLTALPRVDFRSLF